MTPGSTQRFPIRFDPVYRVLSSALLLAPAESYVELNGDFAVARMAWAFEAFFPRASVQSITPLDRKPMSRGVHGFGGRWLVNGSGAGILTLVLSPTQRARVLGFPVQLRELLVSVEDPEALTHALRAAPAL